MAYFTKKFNTRNLPEPVIRLYPLACLHLGSPQADVKFIKEHLRRIADDPCGYWCYMGDGGECVTKYSKGDVYGQLMSPQLQMEMLLDLLSPLARKGLFGVRGNHGHRVFKETGLSFDHNLLGRLGLPYLGVATFANLVVNRSSYDGYFHHGVDSGISLRAKITAAESFGRFIDADSIITAHSHVAMEMQPAALLSADNVNKKSHTKMRHQYICGSGYDSRTGYAEDRGYPPLLPSFIVIQYDGRIQHGHAVKQQQSRVFYSDGQHELKHEYLASYIAREGVE